METLIINVPEKKSTLVKLLLKELGVKIQNGAKARLLAQDITASIKPGPKPDMDKIVAEIKNMRDALN